VTPRHLVGGNYVSGEYAASIFKVEVYSFSNVFDFTGKLKGSRGGTMKPGAGQWGTVGGKLDAVLQVFWVA
jgi:hypothetical protein